LESRAFNQPMPTKKFVCDDIKEVLTLELINLHYCRDDFKKHPLYCLESQLTIHQAIRSNMKASAKIGEFKGEPVYLRTAISELHRMEKWLQEGKTIRMGQQVKTLHS